MSGEKDQILAVKELLEILFVHGLGPSQLIFFVIVMYGIYLFKEYLENKKDKNKDNKDNSVINTITGNNNTLNNGNNSNSVDNSRDFHVNFNMTTPGTRVPLSHMQTMPIDLNNPNASDQKAILDNLLLAHGNSSNKSILLDLLSYNIDTIEERMKDLSTFHNKTEISTKAHDLEIQASQICADCQEHFQRITELLDNYLREAKHQIALVNGAISNAKHVKRQSDNLNRDPKEGYNKEVNKNGS